MTQVGRLPDLEDEIQSKILGYTTEPSASGSCRFWKEALYKSLHLAHRSRFNRCMAERGTAIFCYEAVRPLAEDFEESVSYNFCFSADRTYKMQWTRVWDAWSSQSEQHLGIWRFDSDHILCETIEHEEVDSNQVRFAPGGYTFKIPIQDILQADGKHFTAPLGSPEACWERGARTGKGADNSQTVIGVWQEPQMASTFVVPPREDARFVEVDGDICEVSGDIMANWPEHEWARLMRCRLRFGIN